MKATTSIILYITRCISKSKVWCGILKKPCKHLFSTSIVLYQIRLINCLSTKDLFFPDGKLPSNTIALVSFCVKKCRTALYLFHSVSKNVREGDCTFFGLYVVILISDDKTVIVDMQ